MVCVRSKRDLFQISIVWLTMKYAAAYLLASHGGHSQAKKADIIAILQASKEDAVDEKRVDELLEHIGHKHMQEVINLGLTKMAEMSFVGGAVASTGAAAAAPAEAATSAEEKKDEPKKEEKKEEEEEEEMDMGGLFDF